MFDRLLISYPALILFFLQIVLWHCATSQEHVEFWCLYALLAAGLTGILYFRSKRYPALSRIRIGYTIGFFCLLLSGCFYHSHSCFHPDRIPEAKHQEFSGVITRMQLVRKEDGSGLRIALREGGETDWVICSPQICQETPSLFTLKLGMHIRMQGTRLPSEEARLPGGFSSKQYLRSMGYRSMLLLEKVLQLEPGQSGRIDFQIAHWFWKLQQEATKGFLPYFSQNEAGMLAAMGWGDRSFLEPELQSSFRMNGLAHTLVVSGAHLALVVSGVAKLCSRLPMGRKKRMLLQWLLLTGFVCICQWEPSVTRAWLMISFRLLAHACRRPLSGLQSLGLSGFVYLLFQPWRVFHLGFQLSLSATLALQILQQPLFYADKNPLLSLPEKRSRGASILERVKEQIRSLVYCQIILFPFLCSIGTRQTVWSPFWQLFLTPILSWMTGCTLCARLALFLLGEPGLFLFRPALHLCSKTVHHLLSPTVSAYQAWFLLNPSWLPLSFVILLALLYLRAQHTRLIADRWKKRMWGIVPVIVLLIFSIQSLRTPSLRIDFLDVGQGDAILLRTRSYNILVDAGNPEWGEKLEQVLNTFGIRKLDAFVLTHAHLDHFGGARKLIEAGRVRSVVVGGQSPPEDLLPPNRSKEFPTFQQCVQGKKLPQIIWKRGDWIPLDSQVWLEVLHPESVQTANDENQNSLILLVHTGAGSILLTGDAEEAVEKQIQSQLSEVEILKVGHHGSEHATQSAWLDRILPQVAILSVGKKNRYGHPSSRVLQSLQDRGCTIFRTDQDGTVALEVFRKSFHLRSYLGTKQWQAKKRQDSQPIKKPCAFSRRGKWLPCTFCQVRNGIYRTTSSDSSMHSVWIQQPVRWICKSTLEPVNRNLPHLLRSPSRARPPPFFLHAECSSLKIPVGLAQEVLRIQNF